MIDVVLYGGNKTYDIRQTTNDATAKVKQQEASARANKRTNGRTGDR